jgi:DNA polymerase bacteriophage-type
MILHVDFETYNEAELRGKASVGLDNYVKSPSLVVLMLAWAFDNEEPQLWFPWRDPMPERLRKGLEDPKTQLAAWNSAFERYVFKHGLKIDLPVERWLDPQSSARYLSLPDDLETAARVLDLPPELQKDEAGEKLIQLFSKPQIRKKRGEEKKLIRAMPADYPTEWESFGNYCKQDVVVERAIMHRLKELEVFPLPEREQRIWQMDQRINDRGFYLDVPFIKIAYELASREKKERIEEMSQKTGLENANSVSQLLAWAKTQGYMKNTLKKGTVQAELNFNENLTPLCREILEARKAASSTSYKKLAAMLRQMSPDNRLRNQFIYMGSSRCGRWTGNAVQLQNMARPTPEFEDVDVLMEARQMIMDGKYDEIRARFGSVLTTVKNCLRTALIAAPGKTLAVADKNAIETRVGAWMTGCKALTKVFELDRCPYIDYASRMTQIPYENIDRDRKSKDPLVKAKAKELRQTAKPVTLGCIYRLGGGAIATVKGDQVKTGLWGYAENYGVTMTQKEAHDHVRIFRATYPEIKDFWFACEAAISDVLSGERTKRGLGPGERIKVDKIRLAEDRDILRIHLPSGRCLHYMDASIQELKKPWQDRDGNDVYGPTIVYAGIDQSTHQWFVGITSHGGKVTENVDQGISRDIIADDMLDVEARGIDIVGHAHDEIIAEVDMSMFAPGLLDMEESMSRSISYLPGLILKAEGFESKVYRKN